MKRNKIIITVGFCLLASSLGTGKAQASSRPMTSTSFVTQEFSYHATSNKGRIRASAKAISVKFRRCKYKLKVGQKKKIPVTIRPSIATEKPKFASENPAIVDFINNNTIYAKQPGITYITATLSNGRRAKCKITVKNKKYQENKENKDNNEDNKEKPF